VLAGVPPAPSPEALHEAALAHLTRYGATTATLRRTLERRIDKWVQSAIRADPEGTDAIGSQAAEAKRVVSEIVGRLAAAGALDDRAFALMRAQRLLRGGRSRRAVTAHLAARGIDPKDAEAALPKDDETELAAALVFARRRRIGPFRPASEADEGGLRERAILARAGFGREVACRALTMEEAEAETLIRRLRLD
jgi:regulatory protein